MNKKVFVKFMMVALFGVCMTAGLYMAHMHPPKRSTASDKK
ncbi:MAG TPA: hypothetical protein VGE46_01340 [Bdellovibrio sp.]